MSTEPGPTIDQIAEAYGQVTLSFAEYKMLLAQYDKGFQAGIEFERERHHQVFHLGEVNLDLMCPACEGTGAYASRGNAYICRRCGGTGAARPAQSDGVRAMPRKQPPVLMYGHLTGSVFIVTRYKEDDDGPYEALEKYDVTDQFQELLAEIRGRMSIPDELPGPNSSTPTWRSPPPSVSGRDAVVAARRRR